jgi:hypothetical protein
VGFGLFILVIAIQFIRPNDLIPAVASIPFYLIAIVPCIIISWPKIAPQLSIQGLQERPVLVFGIGILLVALISSFAHGQIEEGLNFAFEFPKMLVFFLLLLANVDSPGRLRLFLGSIVAIIALPTLLVMLNYYAVVHIAAFDTKFAEVGGLRRMSGAGNFGDPNDICEILNCATICALCGLFNPRGGCIRIIWVLPLVFFGHALALTQSRGGFIAAAVGLMALLRSRFRGVKSIVIAVMGLALMFTVFAGRQTTVDLSEGTGQGRIQLWATGFQLLQKSPINPFIGTGFGKMATTTGHVAHNAFVQTYTELGFAGGTLLFGQYFYCLTNMIKLGSSGVTLPDPTMRQLRPFVFAALASFATSEMSLTNPTSLIAYTILGQASAFIRMANPQPPLRSLVLSSSLVGRIVLFSALFMASLYVFTSLMVR